MGWRQGQDGAVLVEMALVVTFLSLVVLGIIAFGILLGYRQNLTRAATAGSPVRHSTRGGA